MIDTLAKSSDIADLDCAMPLLVCRALSVCPCAREPAWPHLGVWLHNVTDGHVL
jgi:hypothetical protein